MHATRARLPQKRTQSRKSPAKKPAAKKAAPKPVEAVALAGVSVGAVALAGTVSLAAHRALRPQRSAPAAEIYALVEWIAPARESWRRGELDVRRSACMPMTAALQDDGALTLTDLPGQGDALRLEPAALAALASGDVPTVRLALPGLRVTVTADDLLPVLPAPRQPAQVLAFRKRSLSRS